MLSIISRRDGEGTTGAQWAFLLIIVVVVLGIGYGIGLYDFEQDDTILS